MMKNIPLTPFKGGIKDIHLTSLKGRFGSSLFFYLLSFVFKHPPDPPAVAGQALRRGNKKTSN
jgi:hypothetical protein